LVATIHQYDDEDAYAVAAGIVRDHAAAPNLLAACKMMASPGCPGCRGRVPWVHNAALTSDIEPLRKICLAFANVWNNYMWPAIAKAEGQAENAP